MTTTRVLAAALSFALAGFLLQGPASAHARLISADPAADSTAAAPAALQLHFSEDLALKKSSANVEDAAGKAVALKPLELANPRTMTVTPAAPFAPGVYMVSWIAVTDDDGHKTNGTYKFTVK